MDMQEAPSKEDLDVMREAGKTRREIAEEMGVSLAMVKRWIAFLGVTERSTKIAERAAQPRTREKSSSPDNPEDGQTLLERAKITLGRRMGEDHRGYLLDGRPSSTAQVLKAAGLELKVPMYSNTPQRK